AASRLKHPLSVGDRSDVAVADHGYVFHPFDNRPNTVKIDCAAKSLLARTAMDDDARHAGVLELTREQRCTLITVIPTEPHVDSDRDVDCFDNRSNQVERRRHG